MLSAMTTAAFAPSGAVPPPAWDMLEKHRAELVQLARARGCDREDAQDLAAEAIVRAATFDGLDPIRAGAFLNSVLLRLIVDKYRREQRHLRASARVAEPDRVGSHEDAVCDRHDARVALRRLTELPQTERLVLVTRAEGHSVAATAAMLHLSQKRVEGAYTRARSRVKRMLLAALVGLAAGVRRHSYRSPALLAVPAAFLLLPAFHPTSPQAGPWSNGSTSAIRSIAVNAPSITRPSARPALRSPERPVAQRPAQHQTATPKAPRIVTTHTRTYDNDRTLVESVLDCLQRGPVVNPETIGCPPTR
jgi:RNA polymerase sigma factor (sigma-70 family)